MNDFNNIKLSLKRVFAKVYAITTIGVLSSMIVGFFSKNLIFLDILYGNMVFVFVVCTICLVRCFINVRNFITFALCKLIDGLFFSVVFFMIQCEYGSFYDLSIAILSALILFIISAISSLFINKNTYSSIIFTTKIITISCVFMSFIDLVLYIFSYRILFVTNVFAFLGITLSSLLVSLINRAVISNPNLNIWYVSDTFSQIILYMIRQIFFLIVLNKNRD